jgi:ABC-type multidrug transport system fused ATPase/permease subunit
MLFTELKQKWHKTALGKSIQVLPKQDQKKIFYIAIIQIFLGFLDLLGVLFIGLLGAISVATLDASEPTNRIASILRLLNISSFSFRTQCLILAVAAVIFLAGRTLLSIFFTRRILFFLAHKGAAISASLISRLLSQPLLKVQERTFQETVFAVTAGVDIITLSIIAASLVLFADISLLVIMIFGLFAVDFIIAIVTLLLFSLIGYMLYRIMQVRAGDLGVTARQTNIRTNEKIVEVITSYRETVVSNRRDFYAREIGKLRYVFAESSAEIAFLPFISKYVVEAAIVLGALLIGGVQLILQDASQAVATLAIFIAAGSRVAPAVLRVQQGSVAIRRGSRTAEPTFELIHSLALLPLIENTGDAIDVVHKGFIPEIQVKNVSLTYPLKYKQAISDITLSITPGEFVAIVGPSGAGKTSVVDVLLGVLNPDSGSVLISGLEPLKTIAKWPGAIAYVPQDVVITSGTIRENVALGYPKEVATDQLINSALEIAQLDDFVNELPEGIDTQVGERGAKISGGQRQRLGIARAMFTRPHLLILDEATSSLDGATEVDISESIYALRGSTTVVMIAHRLSTVRNADIVVYLSEGKVLATGSFEEVRKVVPEFDRQATLMGI